MSELNGGLTGEKKCIVCGGRGYLWKTVDIKPGVGFLPPVTQQEKIPCMCQVTICGAPVVMSDKPSLAPDQSIVFGDLSSYVQKINLDTLDPDTQKKLLDVLKESGMSSMFPFPVPDATSLIVEQKAELRRDPKQHPWLSAQLYEKCPACRGTRKTLGNMMVDGVGTPEGRKLTGAVPKGSTCPMCRDTDGYCPVGITVGQLERLKREQELAIQVAVRALVFLSALKIDVEVKGVDSVTGVRTALEQALSKINKSDVSAAQMRTAQAGKQRKEAAED